MASWWVTAGRPLVRPAAVASMAPVQTVATTAPASWAAAIAAGSSPRSASALAPWGARSFQPPPGTTSRSVRSGSSGPSGRTRRPWDPVTSAAPSSATRSTWRPAPPMVAALRSTSSGPMASSSSNPSNTTTAIRIGRSLPGWTLIRAA